MSSWIHKIFIVRYVENGSDGVIVKPWGKPYHMRVIRCSQTLISMDCGNNFPGTDVRLCINSIVQLYWGKSLMTHKARWHMSLETRTFVRIEAIVTQLIFDHALRMRAPYDTKYIKGNHKFGVLPNLDNLITTDLNNLSEARLIFIIAISAPLTVILSTWFLHSLLGWRSDKFIFMSVYIINIVLVRTLASASWFLWRVYQFIWLP